MFADDTELDTAKKLFVHILEANLNKDLNKLKIYIDYNSLSLNITKHEYMLIGTQQALANMPKINVYITNELLRQEVSVTRYW